MEDHIPIGNHVTALQVRVTTHKARITRIKREIAFVKGINRVNYWNIVDIERVVDITEKKR